MKIICSPSCRTQHTFCASSVKHKMWIYFLLIRLILLLFSIWQWMRTWQGLSSFTNYTGLLKSYNSFAWETTWNVTSFTVLIFPSSELASSSWTEQSFRPVLWSGSTISSERFDLIKQFVYKLDIISWYIKKWIYEYFVDISIFPLSNKFKFVYKILFIYFVQA